MTAFYHTTVTTYAATPWIITSGNSLYTLAGSAILMSGFQPAIRVIGTYSNIVVNGLVAAEGPAIVFGAVDGAPQSSTNITITIGTTGVVTSLADTALEISDYYATVINSGLIQGRVGISSGFFNSNYATFSDIHNAGTIDAGFFGMRLNNFSGSVANSGQILSTSNVAIHSFGNIGWHTASVSIVGDGVGFMNSGLVSATSSIGFGVVMDGTGNQIFNTGMIQTLATLANRAAVAFYTEVGEVATLVNGPGGLIYSPLNAIQTYAGNENIRNDGHIIGNVLLGDGNDIFYSKFGTFVGVLQAGAGNDAIFGSLSDDTLWGEAGNDIIRGYMGDDRLSGGTGYDRLLGNEGDDTLYGGAHSDTLSGGTGEDVLNGNSGTDYLTGGAGADVFVFSAAIDTRNGANADHITDFTSGLDMINLEAIAAGQTFIGANVFSGVAGQVRYSNAGLLMGDLDGNMTVDYTIVLDGAPSLTGSDLIL